MVVLDEVPAGGPDCQEYRAPAADRRVTLRWVTTDIALLDAGRRAPWRRLRRDGVDAALDLRTAAEGGGLDEFRRRSSSCAGVPSPTAALPRSMTSSR